MQSNLVFLSAPPFNLAAATLGRAMAKAKKLHVCRECGAEHAQWMGRCDRCGAWNSIEEKIQEVVADRHQARVALVAETDRGAQPISQVPLDAQRRLTTEIPELDRVLGGGLVPGSLVLVGGDPGIGKSTLMLQASEALAQSGQRLLYVSGEESAVQTRLRAERLGVGHEEVLLLTRTELTRILDEARQQEPAVMVLDSIQTIYCGEVESAPGAVGQLREVTSRLLRYAKGRGVAVFLVGHVTKDGQVAGPKTLEHMVDTVLYFEGEPGGRHRILRAHKNRFGSTDEIGVFAMTGQGLEPVENPSAVFLAQRPEGVPGSVVCPSLQGSRPLLTEVQALVAPAAGTARRTAIGLDRNRLNLLSAVLERRGGLPLADQDIYVSVVGGARVKGTGSDLALCAAIVSSLRDVPVPNDLVIFGEVGLGGELRPVQATEQRLAEAKRLGFKRALLPAGGESRAPKGMSLLEAKNLAEAVAELVTQG